MDTRIATLFEDYGKSFDAPALRRVAQLYAEQFIAAGPTGSVVQTREAFISGADEAAAHFRSVGQQSAAILDARETWYGERHVMVTIHWGARFKSLVEPVEFDVSYLVQLTDEAASIIAFISHEDEQELLEKLGLTPAA